MKFAVMKFCTDHWAALRSAIDVRGLTALVADSGEKAAGNLLSELTDGRTIDNFDPLMAAHNAILSNCMSAAGPRAIEILVGGAIVSDVCPLCFCNSENPFGYNYDVWIDRAADDVLSAWQAMRP